MITLYRLALRLYPRAFRAAYGEAMVQHVIDERRAGRRVAMHTVFDLVCTAPRMRMESAVQTNRSAHPAGTFVLILLALSLVGLFGPVGLVALAIVGAIAFSRLRTDALAGINTDRWATWLVSGAVLLSASIAVAVVGGEFGGEIGWLLWTVAVMAGAALTMTGLVLAGTRYRVGRA